METKQSKRDAGNAVAPYVPYAVTNKEGVTLREWTAIAHCIGAHRVRAVYDAWIAGEDPTEYAAHKCTACRRIELLCSIAPCDAVKAYRNA
jgi:hypothetical protein